MIAESNFYDSAIPVFTQISYHFVCCISEAEISNLNVFQDIELNGIVCYNFYIVFDKEM